MIGISPAKINFDQLIHNSANWLNWIEGAEKLQSVIKDKVSWDTLKGDELRFVSSRLSETAPDRQLLLNSLYITMTAGFEEYLRATLKTIASRLNSMARPPIAHERTLLRFNIRQTARLLWRMDSPPDYISFNEDDLCKVLGSCATSSPAVLFSGDALSDVDGLIRLANFFDRAKYMGGKFDLDSLAKDAKVRAALGEEKNRSSRDVKKHLERDLETISKYRNRIAHTGGNASDVTLQILSDHKSLLMAVANAIEQEISKGEKK